MNIVIVGHVDHGKSTLIGRLLYDTGSIPESLVDDIKAISKELGREMEFAYLLDSLKEEREQNITIDTTQTFFSSKARDYVIIDAPGHREFLKNMITGASMAEAAVLIVDAEHGLEEQSKRHAYLVSLLGINDLIVVVNKLDIVEYRQEPFEKVKKDAVRFLDKLNLAPKHIIPISAKEGDNIASRSEGIGWYRGPALVEALDAFCPQASRETEFLRFPVQDVYNVDGDDIIVGRIESGTLTTGSSVTLLPSGISEKVKAIKVWKDEKKKAQAGESIGVMFEGSSLPVRGEIICAGEVPEPRDEFTGTLFWMSERPVSLKDKLTLKCATQETGCYIEKIEVKIDSSSLKEISRDCPFLRATEVGEVRIKTLAPVVVEPFNRVEHLGRFVLVRNDEIEGGGIISG